MLTTACRKVYVAAQNLKDDARGVSAIEYAILAAVIIVAVVAGVGVFGDAIENAFNGIAGNVAENIPG